jgi:N-acetylneuraminic acid mutarotase
MGHQGITANSTQRNGLGRRVGWTLAVIGGYGEGRVDRGYHHVYDPNADQWHLAAPLPRGANHVAVVSLEGQIYAFGGFTE